MKKLDWTYITKERANDNIQAIAMEIIEKIVFGMAEIDNDQKLMQIEGALKMWTAVRNSMEDNDDD